MAEPDGLIHQPLRLRLMAALNAQRDAGALDFSHLKTIAQTSDGNLGSHLNALEKGGYVAITKDFVGKRPRTRVAITTAGRQAFRRHVEYLREVIESVDESDA